MADSAKKEKIAAAKKRLKQFQQQKKPSRTSSAAASPAPSGVGKEKLNGTNGTGDVSHRSASASPLRPSTPVKKALLNDSIANRSPDRNKSQDESKYSTPVGNYQPLSSKLTPTASTEKLQQLSRQINGLIVDSSTYLNNDASAENRSVAELEARNRELASLLQQHSHVNEQLNKQLEELKSHNSKLQTSLDGERTNVDDRMKRDVGALKEQLQVHIQTIGILVAEKTELQSALNQSQKQTETRLRETEELQGRLKASRTRVADLERSFTSASSSHQKLEKTNKEFSKEVDRLKLEMYKSNKLTEELQQQSTELQGKLQTKSTECAKQEDAVIDLKGRLEMAELHVEQLKNGGSVVTDNSEEVDRLVTERGQLQSKVDQYEEAFQRLTTERDQVAAQYQQLVDQLSSQNEQLQHQVVALSEHRELEQQRYTQLETSFHEIQSQQNTSQAASSEADAQREELSQHLTKLKADFDALKARYDTQVADNSQLSRLISEKEMRIEEMELSVQRANDSSVDRDQLLESMQSDKTALSRAMAQNKELKIQLAELQNGFVKMSNDNMDLMTQVTTEQHVAKELAQRLSQQEDELKEVREQVTDRERLVRQLESDTSSLRLQHYTNDQVEDRLRHYEAQAQLVETLQRELNSAQDTINALTNQHSLLQSQMSNLENGNGPGGAASNDDLVASLNASVRQLEMERNEVVTRMRSEQERADSASDKLQQLQMELAHQTPATLNGDVISKAQFEALQHAMKQLEGKYTKTMHDKADLSDKTEQLEHLIMQLQGETDTIGEYVTLYQHQRSVLRKRAEEKDDYIARLSRERGEMQDKTSQLQALVMQLLNERQALQNSAAWHGANHVAAGSPQKQSDSQRDGKKKTKPVTRVDGSNGEDWPDYESDSDSEASEVEAIVGGSGETTASPPGSPPAGHASSPPATVQSPDAAHTDAKWTIPAEDQTAQKIMSLLSEIGNQSVDNNNVFDPERNFINCNRCTGRILTV